MIRSVHIKWNYSFLFLFLEIVVSMDLGWGRALSCEVQRENETRHQLISLPAI